MVTPIQYVTPEEMRDRFNGGRYFERAQTRELTSRTTVIGPAPSRFPARIQSQMVAYLDARGRTVAIAHQYGEPDGTPASGTRPDPKFLFEGGTRYKLRYW